MLDPDWPLTQVLSGVALLGVLGALVFRAVLKDRREYQRFKRYRTTAKRQQMFRRWLLDSLLWLGGLSVGVLIIAWSFVTPLLDELTAWPVIRDIRGFTADEPGATLGFAVGGVVALVVVTAFGIVAARKEEDVVTLGDIRSMLPRNTQELRFGALMSVNAGVVEELLFRLGMPALIFGATGSALAAVIGSVLLFGLLHIYQGVAGIVGSAIVGALFMLTYALSGTILVPIVLHVLFDLRSLVLIPVAVYGVHRIDGVANPFTKPLGKPKPAAAAPAATPVATPPAAPPDPTDPTDRTG